MAGPQDILRSLAGTHSKASKGAGAPAPKLPAMDSATRKSYKEIGDTLASIQKSMRSISKEKGSSKGIEELAKKARKLQPLYKAIEDVKEAEEAYLAMLKNETATIHQQVAAYNKLAAAKKKQIQVGNEMSGAFGRLKNVMGGLSKANIALIATSFIMRDAIKIASGMDQGFNIMARSGQALDKSFTEMAASTGKFMYSMNLATIQGAVWGHSSAESKEAFALLTQTLGGTSDAVEDVSSNFGDMAKVAKFSGLTMAEAAAFADKNWKRLGKTMQESNNDLALMGLSTARLNAMFGKGSVDSKAYAQTISDLSFQTGSYNQNARFLIESLNRELAVQLSLGKTREAAMHDARQNLEAAGKVNLIGIEMFGRKLQEEFRTREITLEEMKDRFGAEGEMVFSLLQEGIQGENVFVLQELLKNSSELQGEMQNWFREDAARGGSLAMATGAATYGEQALMIKQEKRRDEEFATIRTAKEADLPAALEGIFKEVKGAKREDIEAFARKLREDPKASARDEFNKVIKAIAPRVKKDPLDEFLGKIGGAGLLVNSLNALLKLPQAIAELPVSIAVAMAIMEGGKTSKIDKFLLSIGIDQHKLVSQLKQAEDEIQRKIELGERYDFGKEKGRREVQGLSRKEFIEGTYAGEQAAVKRRAAKEVTTPLSQREQLEKMIHQDAVQSGEIAVPDQGKGVSRVSGGPPAPAGGGTAVAKGSVSQGVLNLEVSNWESILAQSQFEQVSHGP